MEITSISPEEKKKIFDLLIQNEQKTDEFISEWQEVYKKLVEELNFLKRRIDYLELAKEEGR